MLIVAEFKENLLSPLVVYTVIAVIKAAGKNNEWKLIFYLYGRILLEIQI